VPRFSILILNYDGRELLQSCLRSVREQTMTDFEALVVDNGSSDGSVDMLASEFPEVLVLPQEENTGFCLGNNIGFAAASGDLILLLNNDADLHPRFLEEMSAAAELEPEIGMFASRVMMYDRRNVFDSTGLLVYPDGICRSRGWLEKDIGQYDEAVEVLGPNGCAAVYRRTMIDDVGLFDDRYFAYLEDLDLAMRGQLRGWRCRYVPGAVAYHKKSMTTGYHSASKAYLVERNRIWNAAKLFPRRILAMSPFYTAARFAAQGYAYATGRGMSGGMGRDYGRFQLAGILCRAWLAALLGLPSVLADRRRIQKNRRLGALAVYMLMRRYRLPVSELAFKD